MVSKWDMNPPINGVYWGNNIFTNFLGHPRKELVFQTTRLPRLDSGSGEHPTTWRPRNVGSLVSFSPSMAPGELCHEFAQHVWSQIEVEISPLRKQ